MKKIFFSLMCAISINANAFWPFADAPKQVICKLGTDCLFYPSEEDILVVYPYPYQIENYVCHVIQKNASSDLKLHVTWAACGNGRRGTYFDLEKDNSAGQDIILSSSIPYRRNNGYFEFSAMQSTGGFLGFGSKLADSQAEVIINCKKISD